MKTAHWGIRGLRELLERISGRWRNIGAARRVGAYAIAIAIVSGSNFLIVPIMVRLLGGARYGQWAVFEPALLLAVPASLLGTQFGILKAISRDGAGVSNAVSAILPFVFVPIFLTSFATALAAWLLTGSATAIPAAITVICEALILLATSAWRAQGRASLYAAVEGSRSIALLLVLISMRYVFNVQHFNLSDYLYWRAGIAVAALPVTWFFARPRFSPSWKEFQVAIIYGGPIVIGSILQVVLQNVDRYFVEAWQGTLGVAVYVTHLKIASLIGTGVSGPFYAWYAPEAIRRGGSPSANSFYFSNISVVFFGFIIVISANVLIVAPRFWTAIFPTVPFHPILLMELTISIVVISLVSVLGIGTLQPGQTRWSAIGVAVGALCLCASAAAFGSRLRLDRIAAARIVGMVAYLALTYWVSWRVLRLRLPLVLLLQILIIVVTATIISLNLFGQLGMRSWIAGVFAINIIMIYGIRYLHQVWKRQADTTEKAST